MIRLWCGNSLLKELEEKIKEVGEKESAEREALKEEITVRIDQKVGDLASEVSFNFKYDNDDGGLRMIWSHGDWWPSM